MKEDRGPRYLNELQSDLYTLIEDEEIVSARDCYQGLGIPRSTFYTQINGMAPTPPLFGRDLFKKFRDLRFMRKYIEGTGLAIQLLPEAAVALKDAHTEGLEAVQSLLDLNTEGHKRTLDGVYCRMDRAAIQALKARAYQQIEEFCAALEHDFSQSGGQ